MGTERRMGLRQILPLFGYNLVIWTLGNGLLALLPIYAETLGADRLLAGAYLAVVYVALTLGTFAAGWIHDRRGAGGRGVLMASGGLTAPVVAAVAFVGSLWLFVALTAAAWFIGGIGLAYTYILAGRAAGPKQRGLVMGALAFAVPLGSVFGGLVVGGMQTAWGYGGMWLGGGLAWLLCPVAAAFVRDEPRREEDRESVSRARVPWRQPGFLLVMSASLLASTAYFVSALGRSFAMASFPALDITLTVTVAGLVALPFPPLVGFLSDRLGRAGFLALSYLSGVAGLLVYASAVHLPDFLAAAAFMGVEAYAAVGVGSALVTDLVPREALGRGMAAYNATGWLGAIAGFLAGGVLARDLGTSAAFLVGAGIMAAAGLLMVALWTRDRAYPPGAAAGAVDESRKT